MYLRVQQVFSCIYSLLQIRKDTTILTQPPHPSSLEFYAYFKTTNEPPSWQNQQNDLCAQRRLISAWASVQSDQSSLCAQWVTQDKSFLRADSEDSDQTGWMPRLIWVFAGRTCHFVGFVMRRLKWQNWSSANRIYVESTVIWTASSEFGTYRLCEQRRFRRACASAQSRQNLHCSLIQAVSQEEPSDRKPDPWPLWMAGHAQLKFVMTECSKTQIRLARPI